MNHIIPTVFSTNKVNFDLKFDKLIKIAKEIQIDFMDGIFVRNESILLNQIPDLKKFNIDFEIHLMAKSPKRYIEEAKSLGFKKIIFHYEALNDDEKRIHLINKAKSLNLKVFIALNPETGVENIFSLLHLVDGVLLMGVHPGAEHQELLPEIFSRIKKIRKYNQSIPIQIDGGVNLETIKKLREAGATIFNSGSFVSSSDNPKEALKQLQEV